jgi:hypothetical protein
MIYDDQTFIATVSVDQRAGPNQAQDLGASWKELGKYHITSGKITVKLSTAGADGKVAADTVRIKESLT